MATRQRQPGIEVFEHNSIADSFAGTHESWWGLARVHVKAEDPESPHMLANELICARLAAAMGLPVLPGEIATHPNGLKCWVTPQVRIGGVPVPTASASQILDDQPIVAAGMMAFDYWVRNEDRNEENVLFDPRLGIWLIDHEEALAGKDGSGVPALERSTKVAPSYHMFRDESVDQVSLQLWTGRIRALPKSVLTDAVEEAAARGLIPRASTAKLAKFLDERRMHLNAILAGAGGGSEQLELLVEEKEGT